MNNIDFYIVGTPIGNLHDMSERAIQTLAQVDFIAAEDTRNTLKLLNRFEIKKPMISYFEHNKRKRGEEIVALLREGKTGALVSDAGMPAISDPGEDLVKLLYEEGFNVSVVPGPSAFSAALVLSGLDTSRFSFEGFLSTTKKNRLEHLESLKNQKNTLIFYEGPTKVRGTLSDLLNAFGDRRIAVARELTKIYEQVLRGSISEMIEHFEKTEPKGEFVIIVEGAKDGAQQEQFWARLSLSDHVMHYVNSGETKKDAIKLVAQDRKLPKSEVYNEVMKK
ncbi:MAG: 16S rRNA (cytidine(1402)-2'-O)-methyltransferase [Clostridia bacterium]|nr:16S rRNA (cytidine(1402)-2'-O)-methyltransferase [Clostridia bacterium]